MNNLKARVAYLQGLSAGMEIGADSKEGKILNGIIDVLDDFAKSFVELEENQDQLEDYLETIDEDLYHLEDKYYDESAEDGDDEQDDGKEEFLEVDCPGCGETVCFDSDVLEDEDTVEVICPNCDEVVFVTDDNFQAADEPESLESGAVPYEDDDL